MFNELQPTSLDHLALARHGDHPVFPLAGHMFTVAADQARDIGDPRPDAVFDPRPAAAAAIARNARQMLERSMGDTRACRRSAASPSRWEPGPSRSRTGAGRRASATR